MARTKLTPAQDAKLGAAIKAIAMLGWLWIIVGYVIVTRACAKDIKQYVAESAHQAVSCGCKSGEFVEEDGRHYWQTEGVRTFADGSTNKGLIFRAQYRTLKEMRKIRRKALNECANWLDAQETRASK